MDDLSTVANLLGDPGRAAMVLKLMGGLALPAGELAHAANVSPQTASGHLARMVQHRLLTVEAQGRHRYYKLAGDHVGDAVEALLRLTAHPQQTHPPERSCKATTGTLAYARTCYSHLAGWLGVSFAESLESRGLLTPTSAKAYAITSEGNRWFELSLAIVVPRSASPEEKVARRCLDWTERRHHLAGPLGREVYKRLVHLKWLAPIPATRAVRVTLEGRKQLWKLLRLPLG